MPRPRTSPIWAMDSDKFAEIIRTSLNYTDALKHFNLDNKGNNHKTLKKRCDEEGLSHTHLKEGGRKAQTQALRMRNKAIPLEEVMVENSTYSRTHLKNRLIQNKVIPYECRECGRPPTWRGKSLSLVLDHINGVSNDHRLENLRFLCPNCNSQTETFAGKQNRKTHTCECGNTRHRHSKMCRACSQTRHRKVERPPRETLEAQVAELGWTGTGRLYGVSDNAIRKWLK